MNVEEITKKFHPDFKNIVISGSIVQTGKKEVLKIILHKNISACHLHRGGLHLNLDGTIMLAFIKDTYFLI